MVNLGDIITNRILYFELIWDLMKSRYEALCIMHAFLFQYGIINVISGTYAGDWR